MNFFGPLLALARLFFLFILLAVADLPKLNQMLPCLPKNVQ